MKCRVWFWEGRSVQMWEVKCLFGRNCVSLEKWKWILERYKNVLSKVKVPKRYSTEPVFKPEERYVFIFSKILIILSLLNMISNTCFPCFLLYICINYEEWYGSREQKYKELKVSVASIQLGRGATGGTTGS